MLKRICLAAALSAGVAASPAHAAPIGFEFNAGELFFIEENLFDPEVEVILDFVLGENIFVGFTIDDATVDIDTEVGRGEFEDPNGTITLRGGTSGTILEMRNGVNIQLDSTSEFDLQTIVLGPELFVFELFDDIDFTADRPILSDPDNLALSISELADLSNIGGVFRANNTALDSFASVGATDSFSPFTALRFGPVIGVPVPPAIAFMLAVCAGFGLMRRRAS